MNRQPSTSREGGSFSVDVIVAVWTKGTIVPGYDPTIARKDACGAWMTLSEYGQTSDFGWEIDHITPVSLGGSDNLDNLQPLQWKNNRHKSDSFPYWTCAIRAAA